MKSLSQRQLCEYFGWNYKTTALTAKAQGLSTHVYLQQQTGWILKQERYYPTNVQQESKEVKEQKTNND